MDLRDLAQDAEKMSSDAASTPESSVNEEVACGVTAELTGDSENAETTTGDVAGEAKEYTKETVIERLVTISESDGSEISRDEVSKLKQVFYNIRKNELLVEKQAFVDQGNEESAFAPMPDSMEQQMYELLNIIKNKKAQYIVRLESEREQNLQKKQAVIAELNSMAEDTDNVNRHYQRFRELSQEFKELGEVPPTAQTEIWRNYQLAVERFYDQLKVNKDLRDYDFKKNQEIKQLLIQEAEKLEDASDVVMAFRRLQELHDKWREAGPVAKELREEMWTRFKDVSAVVNKRYQAFFEERKAKESENEQSKTALCELIENIDLSSLSNHTAWEDATKIILKAQEDWKKLGFASKKVNNQLFARFRKACDEFFAAKAQHFRSLRETQSENLVKKTVLCEKAEALKDSTDWKKTADEFVALQKQWKAIGAVDRKQSDAIWQRFQNAADYFFEQRKKNASLQRKSEQAALKVKQGIIEELKQLSLEATDRESSIARYRQLQSEWNKAGHVPFRDKERIYEAYRSEANRVFDALDMNRHKSGMANFVSGIEEMSDDKNRLFRERERIARALEQKRAEMKTYQNNLGFFNVKSSSGNSIMRDMERRMKRINDDVSSLEEKLRLIDSKLK
ncbi:DUF349 domain-containing protein [uncultured Muribaculum sp.]|uniref:DUF349 domain-containing protein n=4 Tax=uncultured Muribaculum sp. TaxID=1918613 RepID=UPI002676721B|nr:DUF349 domain-containing protein [uncultured Muribaculum sp.]